MGGDDALLSHAITILTRSLADTLLALAVGWILYRWLFPQLAKDEEKEGARGEKTRNGAQAVIAKTESSDETDVVEPSPPLSPSSVKGILMDKRRKSLNKLVSFRTEGSLDDNGEPKPVHQVGSLERHKFAVESCRFLDDGGVVTGGSPGDATIVIYARGVGTVGTLRHVYDASGDVARVGGGANAAAEIQFESCEVFDCALDLSPAHDKPPLLLCASQASKLLLGYRLSRTKSPPQLVMGFPTHHQAHVQAVAGRVAPDAIDWHDPGAVLLASAGRGKGEVRFWSSKGTPLATAEVGFLVANLKFAPPEGNLLAVTAMSSEDVLVEFLRVKAFGGDGKLKIQKEDGMALSYRVFSGSAVLAKLPETLQQRPGTPSSSSSNKKRLVIGDHNLYRIACDMAFYSPSAVAPATGEETREEAPHPPAVEDPSRSIVIEALIAPLNGSFAILRWDQLARNWSLVLERDNVNGMESGSTTPGTASPSGSRPSSPAPTSSLSKACLLLPPDGTGRRRTRFVIARGNSVILYDHDGEPIVTIPGRADEGDAVGLVANRQMDTLVVVCFGGTSARMFNLP